MTLVHTPDTCLAPHRRDPDRPRRAVDGGYICPGHLTGLRRDIAALPGLHDALADQQAHGHGSAGQRVSGSPGRPMPISPALAAHRDRIRATLVSWCLMVMDERDLEGPADTVPAMAAWLERHTLWLACHSGVAVEVVSEIRGVTGRARRLLEPPPTRLETGERCKVVQDGERCEGTVTLLVSLDEEWTASCDTCGPQEPAPYLRDRLPGRMVNVERVRTYVRRQYRQEVSAATVRSWLARGHIQGEGGWYDLGSVERYLSGRTAGAGKVGA